MPGPQPCDIGARVGSIYREESRRVLATLIRLLGDFDLAEEALHDAFAAAMQQWPSEGVPENARAWLVSTGRFKAIDRLRRRSRFDASVREMAHGLESVAEHELDLDESTVEDDHLRLIFTCCHPALAPETRVALTLREVCGLTTEEIASAYLVKASTLAQRIVRAKNKIRDAGIPYEIPSAKDLPGRLQSVLKVIYLFFNEGYSASSGEEAIRTDLSAEAIRLARQLLQLLRNPDPEVVGLLALMLLNDARRQARSNAAGDLVLLDEQDRSLWDQAQIAEGVKLVEQALRSGRFGAYTLQAAISAVHCEAPRAEDTDWPQIVALYDVLLRIEPNPVVELNRAVAVAMRDGPAAGLALIDAIFERGALVNYHFAHSARAELLRRIGRTQASRAAYQQALQLAEQEPERRFLERRLAQTVG